MVLIGQILRSNARSKYREITPHQHDLWVRGVLPHKYGPYKANLLTYAVWGCVIGYIAYNTPMFYYVYYPKPDPVPSDKLKYDRKTKSYIQ